MTNPKTTILFFMFIFFAAASFSGCREDRQIRELARIIQEWQGKEVLFPENIVFTIHGRDTVAHEIPSSPHKIVVYVDSVGCTICRLHLDKWNEMITKVDSLSNGTVPILFFFHATNPQEMSHFLWRDEINIPVVFDLEDKFNTLNRFPAHHQFQTFLLDEENRVVIIGNPINNPAIREMYLSEITGGRYGLLSGAEVQAAARPSQTTEIEVGETEFDLGTIPQGEAKVITVPIKNIGNAPLIIFDTRVTCSCTRVAYDRQPVLPNAITDLNITYNADDRGRFNRTVSVFGNMSDSPLVIQLRGEVE